MNPPTYAVRLKITIDRWFEVTPSEDGAEVDEAIDTAYYALNRLGWGNEAEIECLDEERA